MAQHGAATTTANDDEQRTPHGLILRGDKIGLGSADCLPQRVRRSTLDEVDAGAGVVGYSTISQSVVLPRNVVGRSRHSAALLVELRSTDRELVAHERSLVGLHIFRDVLVLNVHSLGV